MATNPTPQTAEKLGDQKPEETKTEGAAPEAAPKSAPKVLVFDPKVKETLNTTEHTITKSQLVEAGVKNPFTDPETTEVVWSWGNKYRVPASVFTQKAIERLVQEADISLQDEE